VRWPSPFLLGAFDGVSDQEAVSVFRLPVKGRSA